MTVTRPFAKLRNQLSPAARRQAEAQAQAILATLRRRENLTQAKLAKALGISQAAVSKLERQSDMSIRTLRRYVEAAGGSLEIVAKLPSGKLHLDHLGK
jgi:transcriptional regulator with XRE-family HTH domain